MQKKHERGVPLTEREGGQAGDYLNWENIHIFLMVVRKGSLRSAAESLCVSVNKVRRHISELEERLGFLLVTRHVEGIQITREGKFFIKAARQMELACFDALRQVRSVSDPLSGEVRLSVTEGLGAYWVTPRIVSLQRANPRLIFDIRATMQEADLLRMEADIGIQFHKPSNPDLICTRLGFLHIMPFASAEYIKRFGKPAGPEDACNHTIVVQSAEQIENNAVQRLFPGMPREGFVSVCTNSSTAHFTAIASGAGIGFLPTYVVTLGSKVVPVELPMHKRLDIWMAYHPDVVKIKRVKHTIDWLKTVFSAKKYPWFRSDFVHPDQFDLNSLPDSNVDLLEKF